MKRDLFSQTLLISSDDFVEQMQLLDRADRPKIIFQLVVMWTKGQPLLTKKLLQYVLEFPQKIVRGQEAFIVERIVRNRLIREFKKDELTLLIRKSLYGKDLFSLLKKTRGRITRQERTYLKYLQNELGLSEGQAKAIEQQCLQALASRESRITHQPKQQALTNSDRSLEDDSYQSLIVLIEKSPIYQQLNTELEIENRQNKLGWLVLFKKSLWLLAILLLLLVIKNLLQNKERQPATVRENVSSTNSCANVFNKELGRMSLGEKLLTNQYSYPETDKQAMLYEGTAAFSQCKYTEAKNKFQDALKVKKNNPEALIYLNNADAIALANVKIAVTVPLSNKPEIAWEILRGVAQAQTEINQQGGINGKLLLIQIVSDDNNPEIAKQLARKLAADPNILAVIGHNDSNVSLAASEIYQEEELVMVSPTSSSSKLSGIGSYIMRTTPSVSVSAKTLSDYASNGSMKRIAVCFDSDSSAGSSFVREFTEEVTANGGQIMPVDCDFARTNFNPVPIVEQAIALDADAILLCSSLNKINLAVAVAQVNQKRLPLLGNHSLYTSKTIERGQEAVSGMVLSAPWLPETIPGSDFSQTSKEFWGGKVNWRTAMTYDATQAIAQGLKSSNSRAELQSVMTDSDFWIDGATGRFRFQQGDRLGKVQLAYIARSDRSTDKYEFVKLELGETDQTLNNPPSEQVAL